MDLYWCVFLASSQKFLHFLTPGHYSWPQSAWAGLHFVFDSLKEQQTAFRSLAHLWAKLFLLMGKAVSVSLRVNCLLPTLFPLVYAILLLSPLVRPRQWGVASLEVLLGTGPGDEETVP
jgi:hypothetical protein